MKMAMDAIEMKGDDDDYEVYLPRTACQID